jgi:hypothetical protein
MKDFMVNSVFRFGLYSFVALFSVVLVGVSPAIAKECIDCHAEVLMQLRGNSHHIQGTEVSGSHCYACHWEATAEGRINAQYHNAATSDNSSGVKKVDLVVWVEDVRPTAYKPGITAVTFLTSAIGTPGEREEVEKVTRHCLGCHSDPNNNTRPFVGDNGISGKYAWDGQSVASRYSQKGITTWGKYSTPSTNKKQRVTKSFSAHGNAADNKGGWNALSGYDGDIPVTRGGGGARNVECFDCHNSHGSTVAGVTSSYRTFDGSFNGGILKETSAGSGGYQMNYKPSVNSHTNSKNPFNPGAGLCFDCHETAKSGTTPWGYNSTFGATQPIMGYKDTLRFGPGSKGSTGRFANRQSRTEIASSHLKAGRYLNYSAHAQINGLCTPCHDPHGVSRTLGAKMPYAVPLLKGTWLTSPYLEDGPPANTPGKTGILKDDASNATITSGKMNREGNMNSGINGAGAPREPMSRAGVKYNVDRNTFGDKHITENDDSFGGICLKCHAKEKFSGDSKTDRIHMAVKGWGNNKEHAFPCSKCHQTHNSGLPRLMQTNCFEVGPSGLRESSGLPWIPEKKVDGKAPHPPDEQQSKAQSDTSSKNKKGGKVAVVGCHVKQFGKGNSPPPNQGNQWNNKTTW